MLKTQLSNKEFGAYGERIALFYLVNKGYRVLAKNLSIRNTGEIDILSYKDRILHINEVKTEKICAGQNQAGKPGLSEQSLSPVKVRKLKLLAQKVFNLDPVLRVTEDLDIVSVQINGICISVILLQTTPGSDFPVIPKSIRLRFYPNIDLP